MRGHDHPGCGKLYPPDLTFGGCISTRPDGKILAESQSKIGARIMTEKESIADKVRDHATDDFWPALVVPQH